MSAPQVCTPWIAPSDLPCAGVQGNVACDGASTPIPAYFTDLEIIAIATDYLFNRSCRLFPGECQRSVWPCTDNCHETRYPCAPCGSPSSVTIPTRVGIISVDQITENGVTLDPSSYRLERGNVIVRLDGLRFQRNNFGLTATGTETIITYTEGASPPPLLVAALKELACEFKKLVSGDADCALPPHIKSLSQRGTQIDFNDITALFESNTTGLPMVDYALKVYGNCHSTNWYDPMEPITQIVVP